MSFRPRTLIQLHYHNRPGGVTRVIGAYAQAFSRILGVDRARNLLLCHDSRDRSLLPPDMRVVNIPGCEYRDFRTRKAFLDARDTLIVLLGRVLDPRTAPRPVCVVAHNLTLGKNCALSSAFAQVARTCRDDPCVRFFSVVHDFAEEGRADRMQQVRRLARSGVPMARDQYAAGAKVRFVSVNQRNAGLLRAAGLPAACLPNPIVPVRALAISRSRITRACALAARRDGAAFDPRRPTVLYPGRLIARKNVCEAVLVACFLLRANLLIGRPGSSPADRRFCALLRQLCARYRLPVIFDAERLAANAGIKGPAFPALTAYADAVLSTSIAEGFGYALYEPWIIGTPVIGRRPLGFDGISKADYAFYDSLPVPAHIVAVGRLRDHYYRHGRRCFGNRWYPDKRRFVREFMREIVRAGAVDFGALDQEQQLAVLKRFAAIHRVDRDLRMRMGDGRIVVDSWRIPDAHRIRSVRRAVLRRCGPAAFERSFRSLLLTGRSAAAPRKFNQAAILRYFSALEHLRLLMAPR
jgi:glycosyltransferase involved in cell wall biosynthesis